MLGAITEHRLAARLAAEKDVVWIKVVEHTNHRGADIYFVERVAVDGKEVLRPAIADAKGSLTGMNINRLSAFEPPRVEWTIDQLRHELTTAYRKGLMPEDVYRQLQRTWGSPDIYIGTGGSAAVSENVLTVLRDQLAKLNIRSVIQAIPLD